VRACKGMGWREARLHWGRDHFVSHQHWSLCVSIKSVHVLYRQSVVIVRINDNHPCVMGLCIAIDEALVCKGSSLVVPLPEAEVYRVPAYIAGAMHHYGLGKRGGRGPCRG
jgi:hypothetical protein